MDRLRRDRMWRVVTGRVDETWPEADRIGVVCSLAGELPGVDGAAISLRMAEDLQELSAFTDVWASELEELQFTVGEGPSIEAYVTRWPVLVNDLTAEQRWPGFVAGAEGEGVRSVAAFPLQAGVSRPRER